MNGRREPRVAIVGAGMSGLCMAARLRLAGIEDFTVYEKASDVGGTWRDNTYPGLTCDVPSRFYQFRFAPKPDWSHTFSPGAEIWDYFDGVADRLGLRPHIRTGCEVTEARFEGGRWRLELGDGSNDAVDFLITACGVLRIPHVPAIPGLGEFGGAVFHSARWDHGVRLAGRRVAVIGTGSTGAQLVGALGGVAGRLALFQRTAQWIAPMPNPPQPRLVNALHRRFPALNRLNYDLNRSIFEWAAVALTSPGLRRRAVQAMCRRHLRRAVADPALRRALTPAYEPMCKRLVASSSFYPAIQRPDVELVTDAIAAIEPGGVRTEDGTLHGADVIVLATGFDAHAYIRPLRLVGRDGVTLDDAWRDGPKAYLTVALPGFPNCFTLIGPHSPVGNYSLTEIADTQAKYAVAWIERWRAGSFAAAEPRAGATDRFNAELRAALPGTVWATGCDSWYLGRDGLPELWPWVPQRHRRMLAEPRIADFHLWPAAPDGTMPGSKPSGAVHRYSARHG